MDWQEVLDCLTAYAVGLFASVGLLGSESVMRGIGKSPSDLAADTIMKVLTEEGVKYRSWRGPLVPFLKKVMLNDFRDQLRNSAYKKTVAPKPATETNESDSLREAPLPHSKEVAPTGNPLSVAMEKEQKEQIRGLLGNEDDLREVVDAVVELDCYKPSQIAEVLELSVEEVQNRKKRLRRRLASLFSEGAMH